MITVALEFIIYDAITLFISTAKNANLEDENGIAAVNEMDSDVYLEEDSEIITDHGQKEMKLLSNTLGTMRTIKRTTLLKTLQI